MKAEEKNCGNCKNGFNVEPDSHNRNSNNYCGHLNIYTNQGDYCIHQEGKDETN